MIGLLTTRLREGWLAMRGMGLRGGRKAGMGWI